MAAKNFSVREDKGGTYHLQGELTIHELEELKDFLEKALGGGEKKKIDISFAEVAFIDTAALQLLVAFKKWIEPDIKLEISQLSSEVEDILTLSGLKPAFF
jgi:anti-anti-sigma factor